MALGRGGAKQRKQRLGHTHLGVEVERHGLPDVVVAAVGEARAPAGTGVVDEQVEPSVAL